MKIVFLTNGNHPDTLGGIQTFNRQLKKMFSDELITITKKNSKKHIYKTNDVFEIGKRNILYKIIDKLLKGTLTDYFISKKIEEISPDICILSSPQEIKLIKNKKIKIILVQHTEIKNWIKSKNYCASDKKLMNLIKEKVDYFIVLSSKDKDLIHRILDFPNEKIDVINFSSEIEKLEKIKEKNNNLVMIGRLDNKVKRFDLIIKAMKKIPSLNLKIVGNGKDKKILEKILKYENLNNVFLVGESNNIKKYLDEAKILVIASEYEGYPLVAIEAIKRRVPIIMRNTFNAAEDIIIENKNGILLDKEWNEAEFIDSVYKIIRNYDYYVKNTLCLERKYEFNKIKEDWNKLFKKLLKDKVEIA